MLVVPKGEVGGLKELKEINRANLRRTARPRSRYSVNSSKRARSARLERISAPMGTAVRILMQVASIFSGKPVRTLGPKGLTTNGNPLSVFGRAP